MADESTDLVPRPPHPESQVAPIGRYVPAAVPEVPLTPELYAGAGTDFLSTDEKRALNDDIPDDWWDVLPTGEIYLPQIHYRDLLNKVVGAGAWALMPVGEWMKQDDLLCREWHLLIRGRFAAMAVGHGKYIANNPRAGNWADAAESCKSNALMRCCKDLGIAAAAWNKKWADAWRDAHAVQVWVPEDPRNEGGKLKPMWRLVSAKPFTAFGKVIERGEVKRGPQAAIRRPERTDDVGTARDPGGVSDATRRREPAPTRHPDDLGENLQASLDLAAEMREQGATAREASAAVRVGADDADGGARQDARTQPPGPGRGRGRITESQLKRLWATARDGGKSSEALHAHLLNRYGLESVKDIPQVALEAVLQWCARVEGHPQIRRRR